MTFRADIHRAIDDVTPPAPALGRDAFAAIGSAQATRTRHVLRWSIGTRQLAAIAAALIIVLLVGSVVVGGRMYRDALHQRAIAAFQHDLEQLQSRPLTLPAVPVGQSCPTTRASGLFDLGAGPVYINAGVPTDFTPFYGPPIHTAWGYYFDATFITSPQLAGPVLVRGQDLNHGTPAAFIGPYAAGQAIGVDYIQGRQVQHSELVLDAGHAPMTATASSAVRFGRLPSGGYGAWAIRYGLQRSFAGCFGFQIDGIGFSETIIAFYSPTAFGS